MSIDQRSVANGVREGLQAAGDSEESWMANLTDDDVQDAVQEVLGKLKARAGGSAGAKSAVEPEGDEGWSPFVDVLDLAASPAKPAEVLAGLAWSGRLSIMSGPPKAGKSTVLAQAIGCRLSGEAFCAETIRPAGPVAIVTEEPLELLAQRLHVYGVRSSHRGAVFIASPAHGVERLLEALGRSAPELVIIDSFTPWAVGAGADSMSDPASMRRVMDALRGVADDGPAVLVVHHARRSDGELADSRDLAASVDMIVTFDAVDQECERCLPRSSNTRRLSYLGRWPQDGVVLQFDRRDRRYVLDQKGATV